MGKRTKGDSLPPERRSVRAHAHYERQRIHTELARATDALNAGLEAEDVDDPANEWHPPRHREHRRSRPKREVRHWKAKFWKRRSSARQRRNVAGF